jgi:hypothetical protein
MSRHHEHLLLRLKRLELLSSGSYGEARVFIHALCRS